MKTVLEAKQIKKVYDTGGNKFEALKGINLQVKEGEFVGIMGPSGSGKTTLLNVLSTIDNATNGEILIDGKDIVKMNDDKLALFRRDYLGFIFQDYNLLDTLTVKENIALPLALSRVKASEIDHRVLEIAKKFGIDHILNQFPIKYLVDRNSAVQLRVQSLRIRVWFLETSQQEHLIQNQQQIYWKV